MAGLFAPESDEERVVITGAGFASALGYEEEDFWNALRAGESGIVKIRDTILGPREETEKNPAHPGYPQIRAGVAAVISDFDVDNDPWLKGRYDKRELERIHRSAQFAIWSGSRALRSARLLEVGGEAFAGTGVAPDRVGVSFGTGVGGADELGTSRLLLESGRRIRPQSILQILPERVASTLSMAVGARGPVKEVTAACATGNANIIEAARLLLLNEADVVIAGGAEAQLTPQGIALFDGTTALDLQREPDLASRPFHRDAKGFVMGEGAAALVLERLSDARRRGAPMIAELIGYGEAADAYHDTTPSGDGAERAMRLAMRRARSLNLQRGYMNAHATGTGGDAIELKAIGRVFDPTELVISSTKGALGHMLGAAGAMEAVICIMAMRTGTIPPNIKLDDPIDEAGAWDIPRFPQWKDVDFAVNNSFGFGGLNTVVVFGHPPTNGRH